MRTLSFEKFEKNINELTKAHEYINNCYEKLGIDLERYFPCWQSTCYLLAYMFGWGYKHSTAGDIIKTWIILNNSKTSGLKKCWKELGLNESETQQVHGSVKGLYDFLTKEPKEFWLPSSEFIDYINILKEELSWQEEFQKIGFDVFGHINATDIMISLLEFAINDKSEGVSWWVYEKEFGKCDVEAYDADGNVIPTNTAEELYLYLANSSENK